MSTTLAIKDKLLDEVKTLSCVKTKKEAVKMILEEFIKRRKAKIIIELERKIELHFTLDEFIEQRRKDVPHRPELKG